MFYPNIDATHSVIKSKKLMLQFITHYPSATPLAEQVNTMVHAGVRWIELSASGLSKEDMRQVAHDITRLVVTPTPL